MRHLNDLDNKLLEKNFTGYIKDKSLKFEVEIEKINQDLKKIREQIEICLSINNYKDFNKILLLRKEEEKLKKKLAFFKKQYKNLGIMYIISDTFSDIFPSKTNKLNNFGDSIKSFLIPFKDKQKIKNEIKQLILIQRGLRDITRTKVSPWGDDDEILDELIAYFSKAKQLDIKITKELSGKIGEQKRSRLFWLSLYKKILTFSKHFRFNIV